jgi:hypothetical protein
MSSIDFELEALSPGLQKSVGATESVLNSALGKKNKISVSPPDLEPFKAGEFGLNPAEVEGHRRKGRRLVAVKTMLSFIPDFGCAFIAADYSLRFLCPDTQDAAMVIGLRPREVTREEDFQTERKGTAKLSGSLKPSFAEFLAEVSRSTTVEIGGKRTTRDIWGFGLGGSEAGWRFQASLGHALAGIYDNLEFAVSVPPNARLHAQVRFGAEIAVEDHMDRWATLAFGLNRQRIDASGTFEVEGV